MGLKFETLGGSHGVHIQDRNFTNICDDVNNAIYVFIYTWILQTKLFKKKTNDILFTLKAWNGRCVLEWLADRLRSAATNPAYVAANDQLQMNSVALTLERLNGMGKCFFRRVIYI